MTGKARRHDDVTGPVLPHRRDDRLDGEERAEEVHPELRLKRVGVGDRRVRSVRDSGVRHEQVDRAEPLESVRIAACVSSRRVNTAQKRLALLDANKSEERVPVDDVSDIFAYAGRIREMAQQHLGRWRGTAQGACQARCQAPCQTRPRRRGGRSRL